MNREIQTEITKIDTFGDARRLVLETMVQLRDGKIPISTGMAMAANMKVLNDNIQCEINAAKLSLMAHAEAHKFGRVVNMGQRFINGEEAHSIEK